MSGITRRLGLFLGASIAFAAAANAVVTQNTKLELTGADFLSACSNPEPEWITFCHGYVQAVLDDAREAGKAICTSAGTTRAKLAGDVVHELTVKPDLQKQNAATVVRAVLEKAYPCS